MKNELTCNTSQVGVNGRTTDGPDSDILAAPPGLSEDSFCCCTFALHNNS